MDDDLSRAEAALREERSPELVPIREAHVAWFRYRAACSPDYPDAHGVVDQAIFDTEASVARARSGSAAWLETRTLLGHMLVGSISLLPGRQGSELVARRLRRASELAQQIIDACPESSSEQRRAGIALRGTVALAEFELLGDLDGLQSAMRYADSLTHSAGSAGGDPASVMSLMDLYLTHFEVTGDPQDLERGIRLGDQYFAEHVVATATVTDHRLRLTLSKLLAFRVQQHLGNEADKTALAEDCIRSVRLAREAETELAHVTPFDRALAANAVGLALNAQALVNHDPRLMGEAILSLLRAAQLTGWETPAGRRYANNAATAMGQLSQALPTLRVGNRPGTVLDDAISILEQLLAYEGVAAERNAMRALEVKFNYAQLVVRRAELGRKPSDPVQLISAITDCAESLAPGHRQRAPALAVLSAAHLATSDGGGTADLRAALEAALEAEAITESGAPSVRYPPEQVSVAIRRWLEEGAGESDILDARITAVRKLVEALPEYAATLADRRSVEALERADVARAADYAEIAVMASSRALIVADDLELAYRLASTVGVITALHRTAVAISQEQPGRAVMMLERAQANAISRLQLSLGVLEATPVHDHPAVKRCVTARDALRALIKARREGRISATTEALRLADEELDAATQGVRQLPGMSRFLVEISDFTQLRQLGAPCVFLVAGVKDGVALLVGKHGPPQAVPLPALDENAVAARVNTHLCAVARFEDSGLAGLGAFQNALRESTDWLEQTVLTRIRPGLQGQRWRCIPCGVLCSLPWSAATAKDPIAYTPSIQICARTRPIAATNSFLLVCEPRHAGTSELPGADELHKWVQHIVGEPVTLLRGSEATPQAVLQAMASHRTVLFYAHGIVEPDDPLKSGILLHGDTRLDMRTIMANPRSFMGRTVVLASCSQGHPDPRVPSQMFGPATAFLAAGAHTVVAPSWPVEAASARIIATTLVEALNAGLPAEEALIAAQERVRRAGSPGAAPTTVLGLRRGRPLTHESAANVDLSLAHPYFSGAFAVYGGYSP